MMSPGMSASTIDWYLKESRQSLELKGISCTKPGVLLRNSIKIKKTEVEFVAMNWVYWWNHHHLHESQNYSTPVEVTTQYNQNHAKQLASKSESGQNSRHISCISTFVGMRP